MTTSSASDNVGHVGKQTPEHRYTTGMLRFKAPQPAVVVPHGSRIRRTSEFTEPVNKGAAESSGVRRLSGSKHEDEVDHGEREEVDPKRGKKEDGDDGAIGESKVDHKGSAGRGRLTHQPLVVFVEFFVNA